MNGEIPTAELVSLHRSVAMQSSGSKVVLARDEVLAVLEELLELRRLVERFGGDLRAVAARARRADAG